MKRRLLWVGDAGCPSGFARATHETLATVSQEYDVTVLALNYRGDPPIDPQTGTYWPYHLYAAAAGGDALGFGRLVWMCNRVRPDVIVIQTDGWFVPVYLKQLRKKNDRGEYLYPQFAAIPVVISLAVDGKNFRGDWIKDVSHVVFWTEFAQAEAREGGFAGASTVIPLGVDLKMFYPVERQGALERQQAVGLTGRFIVGNVNRNQMRKRLDLTIKYFAEWVHSHKIPDASLFLHTAPTGDDCTNILQLAHYYGVLDRMAMREPETFYGNSDDDMRDTYNCFDIQVTTTQGEGFGLPCFEGMACGVPQIVPNWSALGELTRGAAAQIPCTATALQSQNLAVMGGVVDEKQFVHALDALYRDKQHREVVAHLGQIRAEQPQFRWENIGARWVEVLDIVLAEPEAEVDENAVWQEIKRPAEVKA